VCQHSLHNGIDRISDPGVDESAFQPKGWGGHPGRVGEVCGIAVAATIGFLLGILVDGTACGWPGGGETRGAG
jgi:hypothetical protein